MRKLLLLFIILASPIFAAHEFFDTMYYYTPFYQAVIDTTIGETTFVKAGYVQSPYGYFTDSLYSPYARGDTLGITTWATGNWQIYGRSDMGSRYLHFRSTIDDMFFGFLSDSSFYISTPRAGLWFGDDIVNYACFSDTAWYNNSYANLGLPSKHWKNSYIDTLHALKVHTDSLIMTDTIVKFEQADSHLYITLADGSVYQCVDTNEKWVSEARVDTFSGTRLLMQGLSSGYIGSGGTSVNTTNLGRIPVIQTNDEWAMYGFDLFGADSFYIDSINFSLHTAAVTAVDTDSVWVGVAKYTYDGGAKYYHTWVITDTLIIHGSVTSVQTLSVALQAGWKGENPYILGVWLKYANSNIDVRTPCIDVYWDAWHKRRF